jgi:glycosyltransferase involved in cell wall biosynthesis
MKISYVLDSFGGGGKERRCLQLIQGLNNEGYNDIQVIIINNEVDYQDLYDTNIELHIIDRKNKKLNFLKTYHTLNQLLIKFNPDIVQVWGVFSAFFTNPTRIFKRFKYIGSYVADCNSPYFFSVSKLTVSLNIILSNYIIGNSKAGIIAYGIPLKKAKVIYNGFNESRYTKDGLTKIDIKDNLNIKSKNIVSMIGRVDNNKDQRTFIDAAKNILKFRRDITFLVIGKGENLEMLKNMINKEESKHIHFLGFRTDVEDLIKISDITVLCTNPLVHKEGVSNSILESLAFGVPVIATNDGGTPEIIEHGINGFLINAFDSEDLKNKINEILNDENLSYSLSKNAVRIVKEKFTLTTMTNNYIELYKKCLNN